MAKTYQKISETVVKVEEDITIENELTLDIVNRKIAVLTKALSDAQAEKTAIEAELSK